MRNGTGGFGEMEGVHGGARRPLWRGSTGSRIAVAALLVLVCVLWWTGRVRGHPWGDDWAGYVLQSQSLVSGTPEAEVAENRLALSGGDIQIGPDAYPWGYPLMLAAAGAMFGETIEVLKGVGLVALLLLIAGTFGLARPLVSAVGAALVVAMTVLQPSLFVEASYLGSDLPFTAISTAALWLSLRQWHRYNARGVYATLVTVAVALLTVGGFAIRSNGVVLVFAYLAMLVLSACQRGGPWRRPLTQGLVYLAVTSGGILAYFVLLPDGSLSHASYLSFDPAVWVDRTIRHFHYMASWPTFDLVRGVWKILPFAVFLLFSVAGWLRRPWQGTWLAGYIGAHLALITVFPFDGGIRYYHPMLPPALVLFMLGVEGALSRMAVDPESGGLHSGRRVRAIALSAIGCVVAVGIGVVRAEQARVAESSADAPFGVAARETFSFVAASAPADARIAFFKPRAFRLLSGRLAYAIQDPRNLDRVDWYVFNGGTADTRTQVPEAALRDPANGFRIVREISPFRVYVRDGGLPRAKIAAPGRGSP